ncbi:hypothetical protein [Lysobacter humi (ex Lee et al. 2017)]
MRRAAFFASLAAVLAGTAVAGPHTPVLPLRPAAPCCTGAPTPGPAATDASRASAQAIATDPAR